jgi:DNA-binding NtrC family response regulator
MEHAAHPDPCPVCGLGTTLERISRTTRVVAESPAMQAVLKRAHDFADSDAPVVILGESGSGKEMVARALHAASPRRAKSFVAMNVATLPAELLESELFGHLRGAFTGATATAERQGLLEVARGGTLFLDEIAELPVLLQPKLLRAIEDGEVRRVGDTRAFGVDVRFVCATHHDLERRVSDGLLREDLYYRLKVLVLRVPPLRDRPEDVLPLAHRFLAAEKRPGPGFVPEAERLLLAHRWPGNVRELSNVIRHAAALARGGAVKPEHLPDELRAPPSPWRARRGRAGPDEDRTLAEVELDHVLRVLERCGGSQTEAARVLGIGRNTLWRKLRGWEAATASPAAGPRAPARGRS